MRWFKRVCAGITHHEYRNQHFEAYKYLFDLVKFPSGRITLHDLRNPRAGAKYYTFTNIKLAKKMAIKSITDGVKVLEPFLDKEYYDLHERSTKVMLEADKLIKKLTK